MLNQNEVYVLSNIYNSLKKKLSIALTVHKPKYESVSIMKDQLQA